MLREFFASGSPRRLAFAWSGLVVFVGHALFKAWLKYALNAWYARFYDELQDVSDGSGEFGSGHLADKRQAIWEELLEFALIVSPAVVVHPLAKWIASVWRFSWRLALVRSYLVHYDPTTRPLEGTAQRIHEDTQRFEMGVYDCGTIVLDSILTLVIFIPVLLDVGGQAHPPDWEWPPWLLTVAATAAFGGLFVSMVVGHRLVGLEVENQKVEAELRTRLVVLERTPEMVVGEPEDPNRIVNADQFDDISHRVRRQPVSPLEAMGTTLVDLWHNYRRLFFNFAGFNTWIAMYDQTMIILPFMLVAPLMFAEDPGDRISLGTLMKVSNAFDKVFGAMAVVTENWANVNEFRSTVRRLGEFERSIYTRKRFNASLLKGESSTREVRAPELVELAVEMVGNGGRSHSLPTEAHCSALP